MEKVSLPFAGAGIHIPTQRRWGEDEVLGEGKCFRDTWGTTTHPINRHKKG